MRGDTPVRFREGLAKIYRIRAARRRHSTPQKQSAGSVQCDDGSRFRSAGIVYRQPHFVYLMVSFWLVSSQ